MLKLDRKRHEPQHTAVLQWRGVNLVSLITLPKKKNDHEDLNMGCIDASIYFEAQHWIFNSFYSGHHRESMPPAFATQLLRDPSSSSTEAHIGPYVIFRRILVAEIERC